MSANNQEVGEPDLETPSGTLAILLVYGLLFAAGWFGLYFFLFLPRGPVLP